MLVLAGSAVTAPLVAQAWISARYAPAIYTLETAPARRVAIVLGARVYPNGRLSGMLRDRVDTAIELYKAGKVQKAAHDRRQQPGRLQ